jgi:hypothetical protein
VAKVSAAEAAAARRRIERVAARVQQGTANSDGPGLLERGREYQPVLREDFDRAGRSTSALAAAELDAFGLAAVIRMARLAGSVADALRECPDRAVRRSAAVLAARAHPVRVAFDD